MRPRGGAGKPHRWCVIFPKDLSSKLEPEECKGGKRSLPCSYLGVQPFFWSSRSHSSASHCPGSHICIVHNKRQGSTSESEVCVCYCPTLLPHHMLVFMSPSSLGSSDSLQNIGPWEGAELFLRGYILRLCPSLLLGRCISFPNKPLGRNQTSARPCLALSCPIRIQERLFTQS